jgi:hypothetical protein
MPSLSMLQTGQEHCLLISRPCPLPTANLPTANCNLSTANCQLPTAPAFLFQKFADFSFGKNWSEKCHIRTILAVFDFFYS